MADACKMESLRFQVLPFKVAGVWINKKSVRDFFALAILLSALLGVLWTAIRPGFLPGTAGDPLQFFIPHSVFLQRSIQTSEVPLWNPYIQYGQPEFYGQLHPIVLLIHAVVPDGVSGYKLYVIVANLLIGIGAWLFIGCFVKSFVVRLLGTFLIQFGPFASVYIINPWAALLYAHFCFLLFFAEYLYRNPTSRRGYFALMFTVGALSLGMYPSFTPYIFVGTVLYFYGRLLFGHDKGRLTLRGFLFAVFLSLGIGVGIIQPVLLWIQFGEILDGVKMVKDITPPEVIRESLPPRDLLTFFAFNFVREEESFTFGYFNNSLPWLTLGLLLFLLKPQNVRVAWLIGGISGFAYFVALGEYNPLYAQLINLGPIYLKFEHHQRILLIPSTLLPLLAAWGYAALLESFRDRDGPLYVGVIVVAVVGAILLTEQYTPASIGERYLLYLAYGSAGLLLAFGCCTRRVVARVSLCVGGIALLILSTPFTIYLSRVYPLQATIPAEQLQKSFLHSSIFQDQNHHRIVHLINQDRTKPQTKLMQGTPDMNILLSLLTTSNYATIARHRGYYFNSVASGELLQPESRLPLTRMGAVRWVVSDRPLPNANLILKSNVSDEMPGSYIYELSRPGPRVYVPQWVHYKAGGGAPWFQDHLFDPATMALIDNSSGQEKRYPGGEKVRSGPGTAEITKRENNRIEISASLEQPGWVVLADTYYPGWQAYIDGAPTKISRANYIFRAVHVPVGEHRITFIYGLFFLKLGLAVGILSIGLAIFVGSKLQFVASAAKGI